MHKDTLAHLESIGPEGVLLEVAQGKHGQATSPMREEVEAWLRSKRIAADEAATARAEAREAESLSISRKALRSSHWANVIAITAALIAIIAIIVGVSK